jgi:anti-sigma B factor antagonist
MELTLNVHSDAPGFTVVAVGGEIDVYTAPKLREKLISLVEGGSYQLILDMEGVEFLDSTGLGVLVGGLKRVRAHDGRIDLVCAQSRILRIFKITGLNKVFSIYNTVPEAIAAHRPVPAEEREDLSSGEELPAWLTNTLRDTKTLRDQGPPVGPRLSRWR